MTSANSLTAILPYLAVVLGVFVAVVYPILWAYVTHNFPHGETGVLPWVKKYVILFVFCVVTAALLIAYNRSHGGTPLTISSGFIFGFTYEATIEKMWSPSRRTHA